LETQHFETIRETGTTRLFHYDPDTDTATIETQQDVTGLIAMNRDIFNGTDERARWSDGHGERVASIPMSVLFDLETKGIAKDQKALRRWLNDPDNRFFRTRPGRV
jgi:hypothetical protein